MFGYTNHTVLPEALERWPAELLQRLLPRHFEIMRGDRPPLRADRARAARRPTRRWCGAPPILDDDGGVRMAHLAFVGSHSVNGVAALHTRILREATFADLDRVLPGRINNKTNGITPRRWLLQCNPGLAALITEAIGDGWTTDLDELRRLAPLAEDAAFRAGVGGARSASTRPCSRIARASSHGLELDPETLFDCQVKRIHEYKRQLLNVLHAIALLPPAARRAAATACRARVLFAGKAAPGYAMAKLIIKLIHAVAERRERGTRPGGRLRASCSCPTTRCRWRS